jgi:hypothetical protein
MGNGIFAFSTSKWKDILVVRTSKSSTTLRYLGPEFSMTTNLATQILVISAMKNIHK